MNKFDTLIQKQEEQVKLRQELRAGIKAVEYMIRLCYRTNKQQKGYNLQQFINGTELS